MATDISIKMDKMVPLDKQCSAEATSAICGNTNKQEKMNSSNQVDAFLI